MNCITRVQLLRGPSAARLAIVPFQGELVFDTDQNQVYIGDGVTPGGNPLPPVPPLIQLESTSLALTVVDEDHVIHNPGADATAQLPSAVGRKRPLWFMNKSTFKIDILTVVGQTINGQPTNEFLAGYPYAALTFVPVGGHWYVF